MKNRFYKLSAFTFILILLVAAFSLISRHGYVYINITKSLPMGVYVKTANQNLARNDFVICKLPDVHKTYVYGNELLPEGTPLLKQISASHGDHVKIKDYKLYINDIETVKINKFDTKNRPLPYNEMDSTLKEDEYLLLARKKENSFDGRYFGTVKRELILNKVTPLFTLPEYLEVLI